MEVLYRAISKYLEKGDVAVDRGTRGGSEKMNGTAGGT